MKNLIVTLSLLATLLTMGCASTSETVPTTTPDGLELVRSEKHSAVYIKPEAQLDIYSEFPIVPCQVAFRKNWQRDYNSSHRSSGQQIKERDIDRIKRELGEECTTFFIDAETSEVLVRAYDSKADPDSFVNYANKITNRQAADRMLKNWATRLREPMDAVMRPSASEA